jgi:hypothetical protein
VRVSRNSPSPWHCRVRCRFSYHHESVGLKRACGKANFGLLVHGSAMLMVDDEMRAGLRCDPRAGRGPPRAWTCSERHLWDDRGLRLSACISHSFPFGASRASLLLTPNSFALNAPKSLFTVAKTYNQPLRLSFAWQDRRRQFICGPCLSTFTAGACSWFDFGSFPGYILKVVNFGREDRLVDSAGP